jgi:hypothetical protein
MQPDGRLLGGTHKTGGVTLFVYDVTMKRTVSTRDLATPYDDIESLAYPESCPTPPGGTCTTCGGCNGQCSRCNGTQGCACQLK